MTDRPTTTRSVPGVPADADPYRVQLIIALVERDYRHDEIRAILDYVDVYHTTEGCPWVDDGDRAAIEAALPWDGSYFHPRYDDRWAVTGVTP